MPSPRKPQPETRWTQVLFQIFQILMTMVMFGAGAVLGHRLTESLVPDSGFASTIGTFALPMAFVASLNLWMGVVVLFLLGEMLQQGLRKILRRKSSKSNPAGKAERLPGAWVFPLVIFVVSSVTALLLSWAAAELSFWETFKVYTGGSMLYAAGCWLLARVGLLAWADAA